MLTLPFSSGEEGGTEGSELNRSFFELTKLSTHATSRPRRPLVFASYTDGFKAPRTQIPSSSFVLITRLVLSSHPLAIHEPGEVVITTQVRQRGLDSISGPHSQPHENFLRVSQDIRDANPLRTTGVEALGGEAGRFIAWGNSSNVRWRKCRHHGTI